MNHLLQISDLTTECVNKIFKAADLFENSNQQTLAGKSIVGLFFENSTRTKHSFELATQRLGGIFVNFSVSNSSTSKGETLLDTVKNIEALSSDCFILRHSFSGAPSFLQKNTRVPVINAGDGTHQHPTQALLDSYTLIKKWGSLKNKKILILGDILHSRVARSNIDLLTLLGAQITLCGPSTLLPNYFINPQVTLSTAPEECLPQQDAVIVLRVQKERLQSFQFPSVSEYSLFWGLTKSRESLLKTDCYILHPGPINRGVEIDSEVVDGKKSLVLEQVKNGVLIRMAVLTMICNSGVIK